MGVASTVMGAPSTALARSSLWQVLSSSSSSCSVTGGGESSLVATTTRAKLLASTRSAQATCRRRAPALSTEMAELGKSVTRKPVSVVCWSKGETVATSRGLVNLVARLKEREIMMALAWVAEPTRRQVT